jgi:hypothetical protein
MRSGLFLESDLDDPNHVEWVSEIRLCAQRVLEVFWKRPWAETLTDLPRRIIGVQFVEGN